MACYAEKEISFPCIEQGVSWVQSLTLKDDNDVLINLTGATAKMQFRRDYTGEAIISLTSSSGIVLGGAAGTIRITVDKAVTAALSANALIFDLFITWSTGDVERLFYGQVTIDKSVTRD